MSKRELRRVEVLARVKSGELRVLDAAVLLERCYRQAKRLWKRYREEGAAVAPSLRREVPAQGAGAGAGEIRRRHRRRRERKEHFGELVQMDGSFHPGLEERGPGGCLMDLANDATSPTLARLGEEETIWAAAGALRAWIERYGVPLALYVD